MKSRCRKTTRRCSSNKKCYHRSTWKRKHPVKRCPNGTRKCRDKKCHKK